MALPDIKVPSDVPTIVPGRNQAAEPREDGLPWIGKLTVPKKGFFSRGANVTIGVLCSVPTIAGLYRAGPVITGSAGVLRSPATGFPMLRHWNNNVRVTAGEYYVVIWESMDGGTFGGLTEAVTYTVELGNWRIW